MSNSGNFWHTLEGNLNPITANIGAFDCQTANTPFITITIAKNCGLLLTPSAPIFLVWHVWKEFSLCRTRFRRKVENSGTLVNHPHILLNVNQIYTYHVLFLYWIRHGCDLYHKKGVSNGKPQSPVHSVRCGVWADASWGPRLVSERPRCDPSKVTVTVYTGSSVAKGQLTETNLWRQEIGEIVFTATRWDHGRLSEPSGTHQMWSIWKNIPLISALQRVTPRFLLNALREWTKIKSLVKMEKTRKFPLQVMHDKIRIKFFTP